MKTPPILLPFAAIVTPEVSNRNGNAVLVRKQAIDKSSYFAVAPTGAVGWKVS